MSAFPLAGMFRVWNTSAGSLACLPVTVGFRCVGDLLWTYLPFLLACKFWGGFVSPLLPLYWAWQTRSGYGSRQLVLYHLFSVWLCTAFLCAVGVPLRACICDKSWLHFKIPSGIVHLHIKGSFTGRAGIWGYKSSVIIVMLICIQSSI